MRMLWAPAALLAVALALSAGCDSDDDGGTEPSPAVSEGAGASPEARATEPGPSPAAGGATPGTSPAPLPTNDPTYDRRLPSAADLGEGWTREYDLSGATLADAIYCGETAARFNPAATGSYFAPEGTFGIIVIIAPFSSEGEAESAVASHRGLMEGCDTFVSTDGTLTSEWQYEQVDIGDFGDETLAMFATGEGEGYFVIMRFGETAVVTLVVGITGNVTEEMAEDLLNKVEAAYERAS